MKAVPERIARAATRRIAAAVDSRNEVTRALRAKRPLDAEDNIDRKLDYIQARVGVRRDTAVRIANYEDPNQLPLTADQKSRAEKIQGNTVDFLPVSFFAVGRAASRSVARVAFRNGDPQGTGFMVSPRLFLTNQHVINDASHAKSFVLEFENELDAKKAKRRITRFNIDTTFFLADPEDDLDFALMAVGSKIDGPRELADFGFLPLFDTPDKHIKGAFVNVIQHPDGRPKETVVRENRIVHRTATTLIYGSDTLPGSSGSPSLQRRLGNHRSASLGRAVSRPRRRCDPPVDTPGERRHSHQLDRQAPACGAAEARGRAGGAAATGAESAFPSPEPRRVIHGQ